MSNPRQINARRAVERAKSVIKNVANFEPFKSKMAACSRIKKFHLPLPHFCFLCLPGRDCAESETGSSVSSSRALRRDLDHSFLVSMSIFIAFFRSLVVCCLVCTRDGTSSQILDLFIIRNHNPKSKTIKCHGFLSPLK